MIHKICVLRPSGVSIDGLQMHSFSAATTVSSLSTSFVSGSKDCALSVATSEPLDSLYALPEPNETPPSLSSPTLYALPEPNENPSPLSSPTLYSLDGPNRIPQVSAEIIDPQAFFSVFLRALMYV